MSAAGVGAHFGAMQQSFDAPMRMRSGHPSNVPCRLAAPGGVLYKQGKR
jgi:hypothetical protein